MDAVGRLTPPLQVGERVSVRVAGTPPREVIGFVTDLGPESVGVVDRRGVEHALARPSVEALRRVAVSLGRDPARTPPALLDELAERAGASGQAWVRRLSDLLARRTPPASVPGWGAEASFGGVRARFEGEWVTLGGGGVDAWVDAAWWATRMGARSLQVRSADPDVVDAAAAAGFVRVR